MASFGFAAPTSAPASTTSRFCWPRNPAVETCACSSSTCWVSRGVSRANCRANWYCSAAAAALPPFIMRSVERDASRKAIICNTLSDREATRPTADEAIERNAPAAPKAPPASPRPSAAVADAPAPMPRAPSATPPSRPPSVVPIRPRAPPRNASRDARTLPATACRSRPISARATRLTWRSSAFHARLLCAACRCCARAVRVSAVRWAFSVARRIRRCVVRSCATRCEPERCTRYVARASRATDRSPRTRRCTIAGADIRPSVALSRAEAPSTCSIIPWRDCSSRRYARAPPMAFTALSSSVQVVFIASSCRRACRRT